MTLFRRRLASCALALIALQAALAVAAPLLACCALRAAGSEGAVRARASAAADEDCCPAGSHPPGQCPRHTAARTSARNCRMQCDAPTAMQFVAGVPGMLPPAMTTAVTFAATRLTAATSHQLSLHSSIPDPPPPRSL